MNSTLKAVKSAIIYERPRTQSVFEGARNKIPLSNGLDLRKGRPDLEATLLQQVRQKVKEYCAPKKTEDFIYQNVLKKADLSENDNRVILLKNLVK